MRSGSDFSNDLIAFPDQVRIEPETRVRGMVLQQAGLRKSMS